MIALLTAFLALGLAAGCTGAPDTADTTSPTDTDGGDTGPTDTADTAEPAITACEDGSTGYITEPDGAVHVWADAEAGGDGSWAHPFSDVQSALEAVRDRDEDRRIAIWPGTYTETLGLSSDEGDDDLVIQGCSPDETVLTAADEDEPVLRITEATGVTVSGLCTDGGTRNIQAWSDASVTLDHLRITGGAEAGLVIHGNATVATVEEVEVSSPEETGDGYGYGIAIQQGATATLTGGSVSGATAAGILIDDANEVTLADFTVEGTAAGAEGTYGHGLQVQAETVLVTVEESTFSDNHGAGVFVLQGLTFTMSDSVVSGTLASDITGAGETSGDGVVVSRGDGNLDPATFVADLQDNTISDSARAGLLLDGVTATVSGNAVSGSGSGTDQPLSQDASQVSGTDTVTELSETEALVLETTPLEAVDPGSL